MMARVTTRARILVVDDDTRLAASLRRALAFEGHAVSLAADGPAALAATARAEVVTPSWRAFGCR